MVGFEHRNRELLRNDPSPPSKLLRRLWCERVADTCFRTSAAMICAASSPFPFCLGHHLHSQVMMADLWIASTALAG